MIPWKYAEDVFNVLNNIENWTTALAWDFAFNLLTLYM